LIEFLVFGFCILFLLKLYSMLAAGFSLSYCIGRFLTPPRRSPVWMIPFSIRGRSLMNTLNLRTALDITQRALAAGRDRAAAPLTVAVLDAGGHVVSLQREDGASLLRPQIAIGKAWGALALGKGSRLIASDAQQRPAFIGAVNTLAQGSLVPAPGGVLIRGEQGEVIGAVGITGDTSDIDELCAVSALESLGLKADAGL
jgi:uncharacterized protein GlcG (DUF336 family)